MTSRVGRYTSQGELGRSGGAYCDRGVDGELLAHAKHAVHDVTGLVGRFDEYDRYFRVGGVEIWDCPIATSNVGLPPDDQVPGTAAVERLEQSHGLDCDIGG